MTRSTPPEDFSSSQSHGVLNNAHSHSWPAIVAGVGIRRYELLATDEWLQCVMACRIGLDGRRLLGRVGEFRSERHRREG
jgi:hypothetical protein